MVDSSSDAVNYCFKSETKNSVVEQIEDVNECEIEPKKYEDRSNLL
mgnify:CR=1 FL=1